MNKSIFAEIVVIGTELLFGNRPETNSGTLMRALRKIGIPVNYSTTISDHPEQLKNALASAVERSPIVITSGGLGPTLDDRTRDVLSEVTGIPLEESSEVVNQIKERFKSFRRVMPEGNRCQALVPVKGGFFTNHHGTAPGIYFELDNDGVIISLPGPPHEIVPMIEKYLIPFLEKRFLIEEKRYSRTFHIAGLPESGVDGEIRKLNIPDEIEYSILSKPSIISVTLSGQDKNYNKLKNNIDEWIEKIRLLFGDSVFGEGEETLESLVGRLCLAKGITLSVAESCTGGLLGGALTSVPGSSEYFNGGIISYSNDVKINSLGVPAELIESEGAVSEKVALEMAEGVRKVLNASIGVGITGIAGPGGGTEEKPVGLVFISVSDSKRSEVKKHYFAGSREIIRIRTVVTALDAIRRFIKCNDRS